HHPPPPRMYGACTVVAKRRLVTVGAWAIGSPATSRRTPHRLRPTPPPTPPSSLPSPPPRHSRHRLRTGPVPIAPLAGGSPAARGWQHARRSSPSRPTHLIPSGLVCSEAMTATLDVA